MIKILIKSWFNIYHSYANITYFLIKYLKKEDIKIYKQQMPFYNKDWREKYVNDLDIEDWNGESVDLVLNLYFPYIFDKNLDVPQVIYFTTEFEFYQQFWNISIEEIKEYVKSKKLYLLTCSDKSAKPFTNIGIDVKVIPNGYDDNVFYPKKLKNDNKTILNISSCTLNKNLHHLITSFGELKMEKECKDYKLVIKGINDLYASQEIIKKLCIENKIQFNSDIEFIYDSLTFEELNNLYNRCDLYVSCGIYEGFDVPIIESKACGLTVIGNINSPNSINLDGKYRTKEQLKFLIKNSHLLEKIALDKKYSYSQISKEFYNYFCSILKILN